MAWRVAQSLRKLQSQVNERWPTRSKDSDGSIGDEAHASRSSDHNPWVIDTISGSGIVTAIDITHDPKSGCDSYALAEVFRASRDPRIKYVISKGRIFSSEVQPWEWRRYSGVNPHDHHVHISVLSEKSKYDAIDLWDLDAAAMPAPRPLSPASPPTLRKGDKGTAVQEVQRLLNAKGIKLKLDGDYGTATAAGVRRFQQGSGLVADGICGPQTWRALSHA